MNEDEGGQRTPYPVLHFLVRFGDWIAVAVALAILLVAGIAAWQIESLLAGAAGLAVAAFAYLMLRAFVEMVQLIVDMLLPK